MRIINATRDFTEADQVRANYRELMEDYRKTNCRTIQQPTKMKLPRWAIITGLIIVTLIILTK